MVCAEIIDMTGTLESNVAVTVDATEGTALSLYIHTFLKAVHFSSSR